MVEQTDKRLDFEWVLAKMAVARGTQAKSAPLTAAQSKQEKSKNLSVRKVKDVELWKKWNEGGRKPKDLDPLFKSFGGMIQSRVNNYKNRVEIPTAAIEHEHKRWFVEAMRTWDPKKGGALGTWVTWKLKKAGRWVESRKNLARISENISKHIGSFNAVKSELQEKLGYEPDDQTIHDYVLKVKHPSLGVLSLKDIRRINREQRKGFLHRDFDTEELGGAPNLSSREQEVVHLIYHQLSPDERAVHEYTFGIGGKPQLKPGQIAKKLKMDNSRVAKLRSSIWKKMEPHIQ